MPESDVSLPPVKPGLAKVWHRRIGMLSAVFVLILAGSGIFLNHTSSLELDKRALRSVPILEWYGVELPEKIFGIRVAEHWVSRIGGQVFLNQSPLGNCVGELVSAREFNGELTIVCSYNALIATATGELIEQLDGGREFDIIKARFSEPVGKIEEIPSGLYAKLLPFAAGDEMTLERLMLDIHSGRILGAWGVYLVDMMAALFAILALSGLIMWWRGTRSNDT